MRKVGENMTKEQKLRYICLIITASLMIPITLIFSYLDYSFAFKNGLFVYDLASTKSILFIFGYMIIVLLLIIFSLRSKKTYTAFAIILFTYIFGCIFLINTVHFGQYNVIIYITAIIACINIIPFLIYLPITKIKKL